MPQIPFNSVHLIYLSIIVELNISIRPGLKRTLLSNLFIMSIIYLVLVNHKIVYCHLREHKKYTMLLEELYKQRN